MRGTRRIRDLPGAGSNLYTNDPNPGTILRKQFEPTEASFSEALHVAVGLQGGEDDVHQPQAEEQAGGQNLWDTWSAQFPTDLGSAPINENADTDEGEDGEERDGEGQCARVHPELLALGVVVNGSDGPGHADSQEHVDSVTSRHIADGGVSVLVLDGCHLTRKRV